MERKKNDSEFEQKLQDILTSQDCSNPKKTSHLSDKPEYQKKETIIEKETIPKKIPPVLELTIRILAAITVVVLLILFGTHVFISS